MVVIMSVTVAAGLFGPGVALDDLDEIVRMKPGTK
jgi:hypothetical protein